ncbi:hypothetical protein OQE50_15080 [Enterobacter kobei]|uniref:hypothetical protein n=1 Tax=Enterobacter kobei TaxID=208224 RepID=UPI00224A8EA8|nr:hypothetical protein [Enterobacter kobei]UZQ66266.1 hypothetical protein OQE50_15080 [Enterobacter kobei]
MIEVLLAAVVGLLVYFVFLALSLRTRLLLVLVCSIPQLYLVQLSGADVPLAFLLPAILLPEFIINANRFLGKPANVMLLGLIGISLLSLAWSVEKSMGIRDIAYLCEFIVISNAIYVLALKDRIALYKIIKEVAIKWSAAPDMTPQTVLYRRPVAQFSNFQPKIVSSWLILALFQANFLISGRSRLCPYQLVNSNQVRQGE